MSKSPGGRERSLFPPRDKFQSGLSDENVVGVAQLLRGHYSFSAYAQLITGHRSLIGRVRMPRHIEAARFAEQNGVAAGDSCIWDENVDFGPVTAAAHVGTLAADDVGVTLLDLPFLMSPAELALRPRISTADELQHAVA